jgi:hypothetical protein
MDGIIITAFVTGILAIPVIIALAIAFATNDTDNSSGRPQRRIAAGVIISIGIATIFYRAIFSAGFGQTAALFVGIPTLLSIACVFAPTRSAGGVAIKSVTIALLLSVVFLGEGILCVLMSAPLFYAVALLIAVMGEAGASSNNGKFFSWIAFMAIAPMSLEGVTPLTTISRGVTISESRVVTHSAADVAVAIETQPRFDRALPFYLSMGFPRPTSTRIANGQWIIRMRGGEMGLSGMEPRAGDLVLDRDTRGTNFVSWRAVSDDSHMTHFLNWERSRVEWQAIDAQTTRVTWTLSYRRGLDPAWYFGPMERYAVHLAAGYLIDSVATP